MNECEQNFGVRYSPNLKLYRVLSWYIFAIQSGWSRAAAPLHTRDTGSKDHSVNRDVTLPSIYTCEGESCEDEALDVIAHVQVQSVMRRKHVK